MREVCSVRSAVDGEYSNGPELCELAAVAVVGVGRQRVVNRRSEVRDLRVPGLDIERIAGPGVSFIRRQHGEVGAGHRIQACIQHPRDESIVELFAEAIGEPVLLADEVQGRRAFDESAHAELPLGLGVSCCMDGVRIGVFL